VAFFGAVRIGAVVTCSSPEYGVEEVAYIFKASSSKLVVGDESSLKVLAKSADLNGIVRDRLVSLDDACGDFVTLQSLIKQGQDSGAGGQIPAFKIPASKSNKDIINYLSFTSGTTSLPKGVSC
jgi:long-subunit acyl-CoA synthetase (AMP-forming)